MIDFVFVGLANQFGVFTPPPAKTSPHQPVVKGKFGANNAMLMQPANVPYPYPPSSSSRAATTTMSALVVPLRSGGVLESKGASRAGVGSPYEHKLPDVVDNEPYGNNVVAGGAGGRRLANGVTSVVPTSDVILPTAAASKGVGKLKPNLFRQRR